MHKGNLEWLADVCAKHASWFVGASVLEIGSLDWNGSARHVITQASRYVGIDHAAGAGVDVVCKATATAFQAGEFDTILCLSVFEHDPDWRAIMPHNLQWVREGGLILICFGAEGNIQHAPEPWKPVPVTDFMEAAKDWPMLIAESFFEGERFTPDCPGCYNVLAVKQ